MTITQRVINCIRDVTPYSEDVTENSSMSEDLDLDSLDQLDLTVALEEEFDFDIPYSDLATAYKSTVKDIADYIGNKLKDKVKA